MRTGKAHDVVHGQKVRFIRQLGDQFQLLLDLLLHVGRNAQRKAETRARIRFLAQIGRRRVAARHQLVGIVIAQAVEGKFAHLGDAQGFRQRLRRIHIGQPQARAQMLLRILRQRIAALANGLAHANGAQGVEQGLARTHVHAHVADGHHGQALRLRGRLHGAAVRVILRPLQQVQADPAALAAKGGRHPRPLCAHGFRLGRIAGQQDHQAAGQPP
ncbi:hypothetical protein D3C72_1416480 [compost metagenome]